VFLSSSIYVTRGLATGQKKKLVATTLTSWQKIGYSTDFGAFLFELQIPLVTGQQKPVPAIVVKVR
jgi:hypothetical protein